MDKFKVIFSWVWSFVAPFLKALLSQVGPIVAAAALQAVKITAENMSGKTDSEKRDYAYGLIVNELKTKGIEVGVNVGTQFVNTILETALFKIKNDK